VNAFVIDPNNSSHLFAGTDVGVYESTDGGSTWNPFGTGLPNAAVFDLAIGSPGTSNEVLRAATHGRGIWEIPISGQAGSHTLTVRENGSGSGAITSADSFINCGSTCSHRYVDGTSVTLTATASAGSVFAGWANCATPSGSTCDETISADKTVTATFNSTGAAFRPDLWIRDLKGIQHGNNVYCSTACKKQTVKGFGPPGAKGTFSVTIQNDGTSIDTIDVTGPGNSTRLSLKYVSGPSCCPTPLRAHEVNVPPGAKGGVIKIVVSVKKGAPLGSQAVTIVGKSHGHTVKDVVKIVVVVTKPAAHSSNMRVT
jgi:hypothetical protein